MQIAREPHIRTQRIKVNMNVTIKKSKSYKEIKGK